MTNPTPTDRAKALVSRLANQGGVVSADPAALEQMIVEAIQAESNAQLMRCRERNGQVNLKVKKMHADAIMPTRAHVGDAALDLYAVEDCTIYSGSTQRIPLGLAFEIPNGWFIKIDTRSSMAVQGVFVTGGVIDASYRGPVHVVLNSSASAIDWTIEKGHRIAQMLILPVFPGGIEEVTELTPTERGDKGFGSTGR